jgi:hypothetical protein
MTSTLADRTATDLPSDPAVKIRRGMRPLLRWVGIVLTLVATGYFLLEIAEHASALKALSWQWSHAGTFIVAILLYASAHLIVPSGWYFLLRSAGETVRWQETAAIVLLSQIAKYIPGNVAQHIGRVALARTYGLRIPTVIFTMTVETGWVIFTATAVGIGTILASAPTLLTDATTLPTIWQLSIAAAAGALIPCLGAWSLRKWRPGPIRRLLETNTLHFPGVTALLGCFGVHTIVFLIVGSILYLLAAQMLGIARADYLLLTGIFALAWVAGFIVPGAPGGIGIREAILVAALGPLYGADTAITIAILLRLITTVGDGIGFGIGLIFRYQARGKSVA